MREEVWREQAKCKGMDPDVFHPDLNKPSEIEAIKAICNACPVQHDCAEHAINDGEPFGIWGGLTERERRIARRKRGLSDITRRHLHLAVVNTRVVKPPAECGTSSGYERHRRLREAACDECKEANRAKIAAYRNRHT